MMLRLPYAHSVEKPPQSAEKSVDDIRECLEISQEDEHATNLTNIKAVLKKPCKDDVTFDKELFSAMKDDLNEMGIELTKHGDNAYFIDKLQLHCEGGNYAFGIVRQARMKTDAPRLSRIRRTLSDCDHSCCIFKEKGSEWEIVGIFSVVELKTSYTSNNDEDILEYGIYYVIEHIWPSICRFGLVDEYLKCLPVALIAAWKRGVTEGMKKSLKRVVKGTILLPQVWGGEFAIEKNFSEPFSTPRATTPEGSTATNGVQDYAVNLYIETILHGIKLLKKCWEKLKINNGRMPFPSPLSGLVPRSVLLDQNDYYFCGSPLLTSDEVQGFSAVRKPTYSISQGDLHYIRRLDLSKFPNMINGDGVSKWLVNKKGVVLVDVLVKVWSQTTHKGVQLVDTFAEAYRKIWRIGDGSKSKVLKEALSEVLLGMTKGTSSTMTFTRKIHGNQVSPAKIPRDDAVQYKLKLKDYWGLFQRLCYEILLPLADFRIIHQDLRPGYDCTYNVMIGRTMTDRETIKMRLIDYESLCLAQSYRDPKDHRYPSRTLKGRGGGLARMMSYSSSA